VRAARTWIVAACLALGATPLPASEQAELIARLGEGFRLLDQRKADEALAIFDAVAEAAGGPGEERLLAEARRGQGRVHSAKKAYAEAQRAFAEALRLYESAGDLRGQGQCHSDRAYDAWQRGQWEEVREGYTRAAQAFEQGGFRAEQAGALRNLTFGKIPLAEKLAALEQAHGIARKSDDRRLEGLILHQWGDMLFGAGDYGLALEKLEAALPLLEPANDAALARLLTSLGRHHRVHGDAALALPYYERALAIQKGLGDALGMSQTEDATAVALTWLRRFDEALAHAERAFALALEANAHPNLVATRRQRVGEIAALAADLDRAIEVLDSGPEDPTTLARRLAYRAWVLDRLGRSEEALANAEAAVSAAGQATWEARVLALGGRSGLHESAGRLESAASDALAVLSVLEDVRGRLVPRDDFRAAFSEGYRPHYDRAVELLARLGRHQEAFEAAERGRARALIELRADRAEPVASAAAPTAAAGPGRSDGGGLARSDRGRTTATTVLAYWVTAEATHVWLRTASAPLRHARLPLGRSELTRLVALATGLDAASAGASRVALVTRGEAQTAFESRPAAYLRSLYATLVLPVRQGLPSQPGAPITIIPDGPLLRLSFAEIMSNRGRYLLEDFTLRYAPALAFAAPATHERPSARAGALLVAMSDGYPKVARVALPPLPGVRREVAEVARLLAPGARVLAGAEASEARVRTALAEASVAHFATHGVASDEDPAESFLALRAGDGQDGRLTAGEILELRLRSELVVLSACRSVGSRATGEGMLGLSRALLGAGAGAVLASVRDLPDEAAAAILPRFYAEWLKRGDAAAALRAAQLEQLRRLRAGHARVTTPLGEVTLPEHPSLWAGFVLVGGR
jgi:CHAT domain-containing protein